VNHFPSGLVVDTSVWINLLATGRPWDFVDTFANLYVVPEQVVSEINRHPITKEAINLDNHPLRGRENIEIAVLTETEIEVFMSLVGEDAPNNLHDGEAAVIALAVSRGCTIAIDERKARRIIRERYPALSVLFSAEIMQSKVLAETFGQHAVDEAYQMALLHGRMHVPKE